MENLQLWQDQLQLDEIKKQYGSNMNDQEFSLFLQIGKATNLNPFLREIYAVKYGNNCNIFIGRDGYRKSAQSSSLYEGHACDAVYSNDTFKVNAATGIINHDFELKNRGDLVGAYCVVYRKGARIPMFNYVEFKEYYAGNKDEKGNVKVKKGYQGKPDYPMTATIWDLKPATMIKKVAEAQGLRGTFQELFAGTYDESEQWQDDANAKKSNVNPPRNDANIVDVPKTPVKNENAPQVKKNDKLHKQMHATWNNYVKAKGVPKSLSEATRIATIEKAYNKSSSLDLTDEEIEDFCKRLKVKIDEMTKPPVPESPNEELNIDTVKNVFGPDSTN